MLTFYPHKSSVLPNLKIRELQQKGNAISKVKFTQENGVPVNPYKTQIYDKS